MRTKALILTFVMILSSLAGCLEGLEGDDSDSTDDLVVYDRSGNATGDLIYATDAGIGRDRAGTNPDDCNSNGGTWIDEAGSKGGDSRDRLVEDVRVSIPIPQKVHRRTIAAHN